VTVMHLEPLRGLEAIGRQTKRWSMKIVSSTLGCVRNVCRVITYIGAEINSRNDEMSVTSGITFRGSVWDVWSAGFMKGILWSLTGIGIPVAVSVLFRWIARNLDFPDGTRLTLRLSALHLYPAIGVAFVLDVAPRLFPEASDGSTFWFPAVYLLVAPFIYGACGWFVGRKIFEGLKGSDGTGFAFTASPVACGLWTVGLALSFLSLVWWPWVLARYFRWFATKIRNDKKAFAFNGKGFDLLWRGLLVAIGFGLVVPAIWVNIWIQRWFFSQITVSEK